MNPPEQIARLLSGQPKPEDLALWLADDGLALLLVQAAVGGHQTARAALAALRRDPTGRVPPMVQKIVSYDIYAWLNRDYDLLPLLVDLSYARQTGRPLGDVVKEQSGQLRDQLASLSAELRHLIDLLLGARSGLQPAPRHVGQVRGGSGRAGRSTRPVPGAEPPRPSPRPLRQAFRDLLWVRPHAPGDPEDV